MNEIQLEIEKVTAVQFQGLLIDFFGIKRSPLPSVYVKFDVSYNRLDKDTVETTFHHFQIAEIKADANEESRSLAKIIIQNHPECAVIFIKEEGESSNDWETVKKLVKEIVQKAENLKYKFTLVQPPDLMPNSSLPPWERIPDHKADREIVKLWHSGKTSKEIALQIGNTSGSVGNILCTLRRLWGIDVVPFRRRKSLNRGKKTRIK